METVHQNLGRQSKDSPEKEMPALYSAFLQANNNLDFNIQYFAQLVGEKRVGQPQDQKAIEQWLLSQRRILARIRSQTPPLTYQQLYPLVKMVHQVAQTLAQVIQDGFVFELISSRNLSFEQLEQLSQPRRRVVTNKDIGTLQQETTLLIDHIGREASKNGLPFFSRLYKTLTDYRIPQRAVLSGSIATLCLLAYLSLAPTSYVPEGQLRTLQQKLWAFGGAFAASYGTIGLTLSSFEHLLIINEKTGLGEKVSGLWSSIDARLRGLTPPPTGKFEYIDDDQVTLDDPLFDFIRDRLKPLQDIAQYLANPEQFVYAGMDVGRALLIVGPPGSGKTFLADAAAATFQKAAGRTVVIRVDSSKIFSQEGGVDTLLAEAEAMAPCVVIFEELHLLGGGPQIERNSLILESLLHFLDKINRTRDPQRLILVFGITNNPHLIDRAIIRPGRFNHVIELPLPTRSQRLMILEALCTKYGADSETLDLMLIAKITEHATPSELRKLVEYAAFLAKNEKRCLTAEHFYEAVNVIIRHLSKGNTLSDDEAQVIANYLAGIAFAYAYYPINEQLESITLWSPRQDITELYDWQSKAKGNLNLLFKQQFGAVYTYHDNEFLLATPQQKLTETSCRLALAGYVAQEVLANGGEPVYHVEDQQKAYELALLSESKGLTVANLAKAQQEDIKARAWKLVEEMRQELTALFTKNRTTVERIADALVKKGQLKRPEIDALIQENQLTIPPITGILNDGTAA